MRQWFCAGALLLGAMTTVGCSAEPTTGTAASCAGPILQSESATVTPGKTVTVRGTGFLDGCADAFQNGTPMETERPMSGVVLTVTQADVVLVETRVTVAEDGSFTEEVQLAEDLPAAPIVVSTDATGSQPLELDPAP